MSPRRPSIRTPLALALSLPLLVGLGACKQDKSNLEKLAEQGEGEGEAGEQPESVVGGGEGGEDEGSHDGPAPDPLDEAAADYPLDGDGLPIPQLEGAAKLISPGAEQERVELRLALADDARYRVTTIGMLKLPLFDKPVGFAREEELRLGDCEGEGAGRTCLLTHAYRNYEAEPPTGDTLAKDEALVADFETSHRIDASGLRITETAVRGEGENPAAKALSQVHRFYCLRLPSEPVGEGATWRDVCRTRLGGSIVTRELVWRVVKLEDTEEGTRAELEYAGRVRRVDSEADVRKGQVQGTLFFWVDAGEPHLMRERVVFVLDADRGLSTGTDLRYQFAKVGAKDELIRTDGKAFDQPPLVLNDLRAVPKGATRDAEHPGKPEQREAKPKPN